MSKDKRKITRVVKEDGKPLKGGKVDPRKPWPDRPTPKPKPRPQPRDDASPKKPPKKD